MEITTDVMLKGPEWRKALTALEPFFPQSLQPNYSLFIIGASIGMMYDKQLETAGEESEEDKDNRASVPRTVLHRHNTDLDFLFQAAILTSESVDFTEEQRMDLAFNPSSEIAFNRIEFLVKFANFGVIKLLEQVSDEEIDTMEKIKGFLASTVEGYNFEIDSISEEELGLEDFDE